MAEELCAPCVSCIVDVEDVGAVSCERHNDEVDIPCLDEEAFRHVRKPVCKGRVDLASGHAMVDEEEVGRGEGECEEKREKSRAGVLQSFCFVGSATLSASLPRTTTTHP